jgi:hypothetical protein
MNNKDSGKKRNLPLVWNRPIDPRNGHDFERRVTKPMTLEELGAPHVTAGLRSIPVVNNSIDMERLRRLLDQWHNPKLKPGESNPDANCHNFGRAIWPKLVFLKADNWREAMAEIKSRDLLVYDCWCNVPGWEDFFKSPSGGDLTVTDEIQADMLKELGPLFIGWDNGENDGRWFWQAMRIWPACVDRRAAYECFMGWFKPYFKRLQNHTMSLCGLTFPHYFAEMDGTRMIGAEFLQALPSIPMWSAWVRGAARQHQQLWFAGTSIFNFFGFKNFEKDSWNDLLPNAGQDIGKGNPQCQAGPDRGPSLSLLLRAWHLLYMYGVNIEGQEAFQFSSLPMATPADGSDDAEVVCGVSSRDAIEYLNPFGQMQLEATAFSYKHMHERGVQFCPVGVLLDHYCGWTPPRHFYSDSFYMAWGGIPYEAGDHQIDLFFRELFPNYQDCPYFRGDNYFLTTTPHGDITDVLLSNVTPEILNRYQIVPVLGEIQVSGDLFNKLKEYVEKGGTVIWSLPQLNREALALSGITHVGETCSGTRSRLSSTHGWHQELPYTYSTVELNEAAVLLESESGRPLLISKAVGRGKVITMTVPFGLTTRVAEDHPLIGGDPEYDHSTLYFLDKPMGSPYRILKGICEIVFDLARQTNLVEVIVGRDPNPDTLPVHRKLDIQYLTNLTDQADRLILTLINVEEVTAYVKIRVKGTRITRAVDWLQGDRAMPVTDGELELTLFPGDSAANNLFIIDIQTDQALVRFADSQKKGVN